MRLIDADALIYDIEIAPLTEDGGVDINDLEEIIKRQPTIEERKTGRWIDMNGDGSLYECDQCHDISCCKGKFCMECGAKMEVEHD